MNIIVSLTITASRQCLNVPLDRLIMQKKSLRTNSNDLTRCDISVCASHTKNSHIDRVRSITNVLYASRPVQMSEKLLLLSHVFFSSLFDET